MQVTRGQLLELNLQFFAQDGEGGEKTEAATTKKLEDARKEGKVAKSVELTAAVSLIATFLTIKIFVSFVGVRFINIFNWIYTILPEIVHMDRDGLTEHTVTLLLRDVFFQMLIIVLPFMAIGFIVAFVVNVVQVKWKVTGKPLEPKFNKLNPVNGFKRIFSKEALFNLVKSIAKIVIIFYVAYKSVKDQAGAIFILYEMNLNQAISLVGQIIIDTGIKLSFVYLIVGLADFIFQKRKFAEDMKMTKQEVKDEYKNTEGDPQIKGKQRRRMMEVSQRRMMADVPKADVVITNPTHIAVALSYNSDESVAPKVVAKGEDYLAQKIKDVAKEADVPIVENKPLARMLNATVDVGQEIPPELYQAVAEILAVVYKNKGRV